MRPVSVAIIAVSFRFARSESNTLLRSTNCCARSRMANCRRARHLDSPLMENLMDFGPFTLRRTGLLLGRESSTVFGREAVAGEGPQIGPCDASQKLLLISIKVQISALKVGLFSACFGHLSHSAEPQRSTGNSRWSRGESGATFRQLSCRAIV